MLVTIDIYSRAITLRRLFIHENGLRMQSEMPIPIQSLTAAWAGAVGRVRTRSVIAPMLALVSMVGIFATSMSWLAPNSIVGNVLWGLFAFCVAATVIAYCYFAISEPERLQTEEYRIAKLKVGVMGDERDPNDIKVIQAIPTANTHIAAATNTTQATMALPLAEATAEVTDE